MEVPFRYTSPVCIFFCGQIQSPATIVVYGLYEPNLVFGIIPYTLGMIFPQYGWLLGLGILAAGMGAGDYYNIFNALTQMPKGARTYLYKFNSYWYMPDED